MHVGIKRRYLTNNLLDVEWYMLASKDVSKMTGARYEVIDAGNKS